jgi:cytochrome c peroxidase
VIARFALPLLLLPLLAAGCGQETRGGNRFFPPASDDALPGDQPGFPLVDHVDQAMITRGEILFEELFELGDALFEARFNALDGAGALALPDGTPLPSRFSRVPPGGGRFTGPNGQACEACHNLPFGTGAGEAAGNVFQDFHGTGLPPFNARNTPALFGSAVLQRLAEEITEELQAIRDEAMAGAIPGGKAVTRKLSAKGISYGEVTVSRDAGGAISVILSEPRAIDPDLVVRPYGWKGNVTTLRDFCRGAALNELGMEPDELVAKDPLGRSDPDGDGIEGELSVGDITALTIYVGAQEIPQPLSRLVRDGLAPPPSAESGVLAERGSALFVKIGCAACHIPELRLDDPVFEEPTLRGRGNYFDAEIDHDATFLDPQRPFRFHLVREGDFPRLEPHPAAGARVALFGDLKRHYMGEQLADPMPTRVKGANGRNLVLDGMEIVVEPAVFLTAELWGVGSTGPWLHDGRAGTLEEAILLHGIDAPPPPGDPARSEAQKARDAFAALPERDRLAVVEFLRSLVLFELPEG